jgi:glycosyltransferase involved in cell wall biosynthesis
MKKSPQVSIIMPALNSEKTIMLSIVSVRKQSFDQDLIEILVIDGGSTDKTREIAKEFNCKILENPKMRPEYAKYVGVLNAKGRYAVLLDSDQALSNMKSLEDKVNLLENHQDVKQIVVAGLKSPDGTSPINDYYNRFGEPFSFFMHNMDGRDYIEGFAKRYRKDFENDDMVIFKFTENVASPIVDAGGHFFDLSYLKDLYSPIDNPDIIPRIFNLIAAKTKKVAILKNDFIVHYLNASFKKNISKIRYRIIENVHYSSGTGVGFANTEEFQPRSFQLKKYLFIPFAFSLILPLFVSVRLSVSNRRIAFLLHFPLTVYTAVYITYQYCLRVIGIKPRLGSYGEQGNESQGRQT